MTKKNIAVSTVLFAASSLLLVLLLGPIGIGIVLVMGFLLLTGLFSSMFKK
jgi:hypothetical protein